MVANLIKKLSLCAGLLAACQYLPAAEPGGAGVPDVPNSIFSGLQGNHHVQGIAVDLEKGYICFSFTTKLVKTDLQGRLIGSVDGLTGHLGCITVSPTDGRVYGSLEYKNDAIGVGIAGESAKNRESAFYIAVFDPDKITRPNMSPESDNVMATVYLKDVVDDYYGKAVNNGKTFEHRYGCSGIDGVMFAPKPGKRDGEPLLNVAYGIYGDTSRSDNDYQVILAYDVRNWKKYETPLSQEKPHKNGPSKPADRYFVFTGNTNWGIQNLEYDPAAGMALAAVYNGKKAGYPNYSLFCIDWNKPAKRMALKGFDHKEYGKVLSLCQIGDYDEASGVYGWHFPWGATGMSALGDGYFYISHNSNWPEQNATVHLYKWTGETPKPFELVGEAELRAAAKAYEFNDWPNFKRYHKSNQEVKQLPANERRVVFIGNSITDNWARNRPEFFKSNGYIGRGIGGQTSYQFVSRFREDVINLRPKIVVINAATNDIAENILPYDEDVTVGNIISMIELAQANGITPVLTTTLPASQFPWRKEITDASDKIASLNNRLRNLAKQRGIVFVDYYSSMFDPSDSNRCLNKKYTGDGVHPNNAGYEIMESIIKKVLDGMTDK